MKHFMHLLGEPLVYVCVSPYVYNVHVCVPVAIIIIHNNVIIAIHTVTLQLEQNFPTIPTTCSL